MSPTEVVREEGVVADSDDTAAIETIGAAYEAWVSDIGSDPATTDMAGEELEEIDAVRTDLSEKVVSPDLESKENIRDVMLDQKHAEAILDNAGWYMDLDEKHELRFLTCLQSLLMAVTNLF